MSSASARKEMNEIKAIIRRKGYKVAPSGGGHWAVLDKNGSKVIDEHGAVVISSSPSDFRARDLAWARLERCGVVTPDDNPWKPQKKKGGRGGLILAEDGGGEGRKVSREERRLQERHESAMQIKNDARTRHERTQQIRGRVEPLLSKLGGWTKRGMQSEIALVLFKFSEGAPFAFASHQSTIANVQSLRKGGTLSDNAALAWEALLTDIEQAPSMTERWWNLVREARGLPPLVVATSTTMEPDERKLVLAPRVGRLNQELAAREGERYQDHEHPVLEFHRNGGVRWNVDFTIDDLNALNRSLGVFEGLGVQLSVFEGQELVAAAVERLTQIVEKVGEARHRELAKRAEEG